VLRISYCLIRHNLFSTNNFKTLGKWWLNIWLGANQKYHNTQLTPSTLTESNRQTQWLVGPYQTKELMLKWIWHISRCLEIKLQVPIKNLLLLIKSGSSKRRYFCLIWPSYIFADIRGRGHDHTTVRTHDNPSMDIKALTRWMSLISDPEACVTPG